MFCLFVCFCLASSLLETSKHTLTCPKCFSLWILQISAGGVWMGQGIRFCDCDKMHEENSLQEGRALRGPGCWGFSPWLTPWLWAQGGKSGHRGVGTHEAAQSLSVQDRTDRKWEAGHICLSICPSVSLWIRYTLQWLHPICVSEAERACLSPWSWSYGQFWAARCGTQTLVLWKRASSLNQPRHLSSTQIFLILYVGMSKVEMEDWRRKGEDIIVQRTSN